jgi:hypothetical protein
MFHAAIRRVMARGLQERAYALAGRVPSRGALLLMLLCLPTAGAATKAPIPFEKSFRVAHSRTHCGTGYYIYQQYVPDAPLPELAWTELRYDAYCFVMPAL